MEPMDKREKGRNVLVRRIVVAVAIGLATCCFLWRVVATR